MSAQPLTRTCVDAVRKSTRSQPIHLGPKPCCRNMLRRNNQETLSKARATSNLSSKAGTFLR
jgi:hypothetical protein